MTTNRLNWVANDLVQRMNDSLRFEPNTSDIRQDFIRRAQRGLPQGTTLRDVTSETDVANNTACLQFTGKNYSRKLCLGPATPDITFGPAAAAS